MGVAVNQPEIRFNKQGPFSFEGVSYLPKIIFFEKKNIAGTENHDFITLPAQTFISEAFIKVDTVVNNSGVVTLGLSDDPDALIDNTEFNIATENNFAKHTDGLFLGTRKSVRLAISGTADEGAVSGYLVVYEIASMKNRGIHFSM